MRSREPGKYGLSNLHLNNLCNLFQCQLKKKTLFTKLKNKWIEEGVKAELKKIVLTQDAELVAMAEKSATKKIVKAFVSGGTQYFKFEDINNILSGRAFAARDFFTEMSMKCSREYLVSHCEAIDKIMTSAQLDISKIGQLHQQLKERLELIISPETCYKIASVIYWDKTEAPYSFDYNYSRTKIQKWKDENVSDFFLLTHLRDLIPALDLSEKDLKTYIQVGEQVEMEHLKVLESISTM